MEFVKVVALVSAAALCASGSGSGSSGCGEGQFWDASRGLCLACTRCAGPGREVTLRPCEGHRDSLCGSLHDLNIDWSWLKPAQHGGGDSHPKEGHTQHGLPLPQGWLDALSRSSSPASAPQGQGRRAWKANRDKQDDGDSKFIFDEDYVLPEELLPTPKHNKKQSKKHRFQSAPRPRPLSIEDDDDYADLGSGDDEDDLDDEQLVLPRVRSTSTSTPVPSLVEDLVVLKGPEDARVEPANPADADGSYGDVSMRAAFTPVETLVWDWQAGVLVAAVCACVLFFVVAAVYAYQHVWHFRVLKKRLNADVEEISSRLALMSGMGHEHFQEPGSPPLGHHMQMSGQQKMNEYSVPRRSKV